MKESIYFLFNQIKEKYGNFRVNIPKQEYLEELQEYNEKGRAGQVVRYSKYSHLKSIFNDFLKLATIWLEDCTELKETSSELSYKKKLSKAQRYLIKHGIISLEQLFEEIPPCEICQSKLSVPHSKDSGEENWMLVHHCNNKVCRGKYGYKQSSKGIMKKYGVDNISKLEEIKRKKEKTSLKNYGVKYHTQSKKQMDKIRKNVKEKYGVNNVSQLKEVKEKKKQTFMEHYGVDNIFKRTDLMEEYWIKTLGVSNPVYYRDNILKFIYANNKKYEKVIRDRKFIFLSENEEFVVNSLNEFIKIGAMPRKFFNDMKVNEKVLFRDKENYLDERNCWVVDIGIYDMNIEIKSDVDFHICYNDRSLKKYFDLCKLFDQKFIMYIIEKSTGFDMAYIDLNNNPYLVVDNLSDPRVSIYKNALDDILQTNLQVIKSEYTNPNRVLYYVFKQIYFRYKKFSNKELDNRKVITKEQLFF